ncbi:MAG TPA: cohesin domain-containing protein, partial [Candidatus Polarisedimenticolaceae bacterium]|nr:cohesin domain-containing protein [Candidatus Polarisedimenticolaceae bacterium]
VSAKLRIIGLLFLVALVGAVIFVLNPPKKPTPKATIGSPATQEQGNHQLKVPIEIDTGGRTINAAEIKLTFDPRVIEVVSVSKEKSFFKIWITNQPSFSNAKGTISFAGGIFTPGFSGKGQVGAVTLKSKRALTSELKFGSGTQVLLNDGKGTAVPLELSPIKIKIP